MITGITILICIVLLIISVQDIRSREVDYWVFPALLIGSIVWLYFQGNAPRWVGPLMNLGFVSVLFLSLVLYVSVKRRKLTNVFKADFALGDLLYLVCITPLFATRNMILYVILGMVFSLILHLIFKKKNGVDTVPLAGYLSIFLIAVFVFNFFVETNIFYTELM